jgi:hypothetical protein
MKASNLIAVLVGLVIGLSVGMIIPRSGRSKPGALNAPTAGIAAALIKGNVAQSDGARESAPLEELRRLLSSGSNHDFAECLLIVRKLSLQDCREAHRLLASAPGNARGYLLDALAFRWSELDPLNAFDAALLERENDFRNRLGTEAARVLVNSDPDGVLARLTNAKGSELRERIANWVLPALARRDPARAASYVTAEKRFPNRERFLQMISVEYGRAAPAEALKWAESLEPKHLRDEITKNTWIGWADADPVAVAKQLNPGDSQLQEIFAAAARAWSKKDPAAAMSWIESLPAGDARNRAYDSYEIDVHGLGAAGARALLDSVTSEKYKENLANRIAQQLIEDSPAEALQWVESLPEGEVRENALQPVVSEWASRDPAQAAQYISTISDGAQKPRMLSYAVGRWADMDPDAAISFVRQLPPGSEQDQAAAAAIRTEARTDPGEAVAWLGTIRDASSRARVTSDLVGSLAHDDPTTALSLATALPGEAQPQAYRNLVRGWAFDHASEAGEWLKTLQPGKARDSAVQAYISVIDGMDAGLATQWAQTIQEPEARANTFVKAFQHWRSEDKNSAIEWLNQNPLPDDYFRPLIDRALRESKRK